ncbi:hypothetical protein QTO34_018919 [Cnephaeus nilssonii]|uniref:Nucleophosmin n=1 Tax=Cnephaeus nilssonii TaxID=3371016 RepID=A0AA40LND7_CNENI|nr:hypothetical protein QTO34_018919 [Eptesicus nilssonii]
MVEAFVQAVLCGALSPDFTAGGGHRPLGSDHSDAQNSSCELKADKDYHFKVDNDENEHQLSLRTVSLGAGAKDELHIVEAEAVNYEGGPIKVTLATLKMSVQPTWLIKEFILAVEEDAESEDDEEEDVKLLRCLESHQPLEVVARSRSDDDDDFDDDEAEEKAPVKKSIRDTPAKNAQKSNQNGKDSKPSTPRSKGSVKDYQK